MVKILEGETLTAAYRRDIKERLDALGSGSIGDLMRANTVRISEAKTQYQAFEMAARVEKFIAVRYWVSGEDLPDAVKEILLKNQPYVDDQVVVAATYPVHGGQAGGGGANVSLIVLPSPRYENAHAVEVEVGCSHEMQTTNLGRCYNRYSCVKCGFEYSIDSSD